MKSSWIAGPMGLSPDSTLGWCPHALEPTSPCPLGGLREDLWEEVTFGGGNLRMLPSEGSTLSPSLLPLTLYVLSSPRWSLAWPLPQPPCLHWPPQGPGEVSLHPGLMLPLPCSQSSRGSLVPPGQVPAPQLTLKPCGVCPARSHFPHPPPSNQLCK